MSLPFLPDAALPRGVFFFFLVLDATLARGVFLADRAVSGEAVVDTNITWDEMRQSYGTNVDVHTGRNKMFTRDEFVCVCVCVVT